MKIIDLKIGTKVYCTSKPSFCYKSAGTISLIHGDGCSFSVKISESIDAGLIGTIVSWRDLGSWEIVPMAQQPQPISSKEIITVKDLSDSLIKYFQK